MTAVEPTTGDPVRDALAAAAEAVRNANGADREFQHPSDLADRAAALADLCGRIAVAAHDLGTDVRNMNRWRQLMSREGYTVEDCVESTLSSVDILHEDAHAASRMANSAFETLSRLTEAPSR